MCVGTLDTAATCSNFVIEAPVHCNSDKEGSQSSVATPNIAATGSNFVIEAQAMPVALAQLGAGPSWPACPV